MGPQPSSGRPAVKRGLAVQPEAGRGLGRGGQRHLVSQSFGSETTGCSSSSGKGGPSAPLVDSNGFQGREGRVQGVMTILPACPRPGTPRGWGPLPVPGKAPGACRSTSTPPRRQEGEVAEYCLKYAFLFINAAEERRGTLSPVCKRGG